MNVDLPRRDRAQSRMHGSFHCPSSAAVAGRFAAPNTATCQFLEIIILVVSDKVLVRMAHLQWHTHSIRLTAHTWAKFEHRLHSQSFSVPNTTL